LGLVASLALAACRFRRPNYLYKPKLGVRACLGLVASLGLTACWFRPNYLYQPKLGVRACSGWVASLGLAACWFRPLSWTPNLPMTAVS